MNELFTIPATQPDRLATARRRFDAALIEYEESVSVDFAHATQAHQDRADKGYDEFIAARAELHAAEEERLKQFDV